MIVSYREDVFINMNRRLSAHAAIANDLEEGGYSRLKRRGEPRATHRRPKRRYKKRVRMLSKLEPHVALSEGWLAAGPQLTAMAIVASQAERYPEQFDNKQHFDRAASAASLAQDLRAKTGR